MRTLRRRYILLPALLAAGGCSTIQPQDVFREVQGTVASRTNAEVVWNQGTADDAAAEHRLGELLQHPVDAQSATQVALLNNRNLQAVFEEIGLAQADLVQAGLLTNPVLSIERRFTGKAFEVDVAQEILDLILVPLRRRIAGAALETVTLQVTQAVLDLAADVRGEVYALQGAEQMILLRRSLVVSSEAAADLARRLQEAGNITELALRMEQSVARQARLDLADAEDEAYQHRERLNTLMGLWGRPAAAWRVSPQLPELPQAEISQPGIESLAVSQRLDLAAARQDIVASAESLHLTRYLRFVSSIEAGSHFEREKDGANSFGPSFAFAIPVFDWGQAAVPKGHAVVRQKQQTFIALAIEIRSQVRSALSRMLAARRRAEFYAGTVLPLQADLLRHAQLQYNAMIMSPLHLFELRQTQIDSERQRIESLRQYWMARAELEQAVGGFLPITNSDGTVDNPAMPDAVPPASAQPVDHSTHEETH